MSNPGLTDDHVDANDKSFLTTFPYLASPHWVILCDYASLRVKNRGDA
jgi:hypothetical protein